jgi:hypothetical protein
MDVVEFPIIKESSGLSKKVVSAIVNGKKSKIIKIIKHLILSTSNY